MQIPAPVGMNLRAFMRRENQKVAATQTELQTQLRQKRSGREMHCKRANAQVVAPRLEYSGCNIGKGKRLGALLRARQISLRCERINAFDLRAAEYCQCQSGFAAAAREIENRLCGWRKIPLLRAVGEKFANNRLVRIAIFSAEFFIKFACAVRFILRANCF